MIINFQDLSTVIHLLRLQGLDLKTVIHLLLNILVLPDRAHHLKERQYLPTILLLVPLILDKKGYQDLDLYYFQRTVQTLSISTVLLIHLQHYLHLQASLLKVVNLS